jgi:DNA repair protein RecO (recombination protein O)
MFQKYRGFILKTGIRGESDLQVVLFTDTVGILNVTAKGALKSKKRFSGGVLEPINYIECEVQSHRWLQEAKLLEGFEGVRTDYARIELALLFLKYYYNLQINSEGQVLEHHQALFYLLGHTLRALCNQEDLKRVESQFLAKLLHEQGVLDLSQDLHSLTELVQVRFQAPLKITEHQFNETLKNLRAQIAEYLNLK